MYKHKVQSALLLGATASAMFPSVAFAAEEENKGLMLLIPNMAEFIPACVAFIIIFIILKKLAWPSIVQTLEDREKKIQGDFDDAAKAKEQAHASAQAYEQKIIETKMEAEEIRAQARREAEAERAEILAEAQREAAATIAKAKDAVSNERKKAMIELSGQVVDLSVEIASKIIGSELPNDVQRNLAEKYLQEVTAGDGE